MSAVAARRVGCGLALAGALLFQILDVGYLAHFLFWAALALPVLSLLLTLPALAGCRGTLTAAAPAGERGTPVRFRSGVGCRGPLPPPRVVARLALGNALTGETARRRVVLTGLPDRADGLGAWTDWETPHCGRLTCRVERLRVVDGLEPVDALLPEIPVSAYLMERLAHKKPKRIRHGK